MGCEIKRILQFNEAIVYRKVVMYNIDNQDITDLCSFSWSSDGVCWTNWTNRLTYDQICQNLETDFYLRILFVGSFSRVSLDGVFVSCYNISLDPTVSFLENFCGDPNLFNPYQNLDCAIMLQQQLADSIVCMLGIPIYYIRIQPNESSADITFKEYVLHKVDSVKQLKLMIPDGQMPSSNPKLTEFDFDWETDWETELSKTQFATAFGDTAFPKAGDVIYIPMMKRMWEVNSAYDEKNEGLMWRSTTWKLALVKYSDSTNVETEGFDEIFDNLASHTYEEVFGKVERMEQERESGTNQVEAPKFAANNLYNIFTEDAVRKQYTKEDIIVLDKQFNHRSNVVARNIYKFKNENGCITYQKQICGDEGTLSFIIETQGTLNGDLEREILTFGEIRPIITYNKDNRNFTINFNDMQQDLDPFTTYMVQLKWNIHTFVTEMNIYKYTHREDLPIYKLNPMMYWFDFENPICEMTCDYNNDYHHMSPQDCQIHCYPLYVTNIKLYNRYLDKEESIKESCKYTTAHKNCIINDLARPISSGMGYMVK